MSSKQDIGLSPKAVRTYFVDNVVPLARELGLLGNLSYFDFVGALAEKDPNLNDIEAHRFLYSILRAAHEQRTPKDVAVFRFAITAMCLEIQRDAKTGALKEDRLMPETNRLEVIRLQGYLQAMKDTRADTIRRGANGRRLIGATSRDKVRRAAIQLDCAGSKEFAAPSIAEAVGLSPARVRKLLGELFPGDAWPPK